MTPSERLRQEIFDDSSKRLSEIASRAVNVHRLKPTDVAVVAIHVDDPAWTDLADILMPGEDWQRFRDQGMKPIARGSVFKTIIEYICTTVPALKVALEVEPPDGHLYAFVMDGGGASLYAVPYGRN